MMNDPNDSMPLKVTLLNCGSAVSASVESAQEGEVLIFQGKPEEHILIIEEGQIDIFIHDKLISTFSAPTIAGEMSLLFGHSVATVKARTKVFFKKVAYSKLMPGDNSMLRKLAEDRNRSNLEHGRYSQK
jgi:hypothetical protein